MLKTRVITAVILLAILLPVLFWGELLPFAIVLSVFFGAAAWECFRLFASKRGNLWAALWAIAFALVIFVIPVPIPDMVLRTIFGVSVALWVLRFVPALKLGLPPLGSQASGLLSATYMLSVFGCFIAIDFLFQRSPLYLLSVMVIVWVADIGAYFAGKGFGRHKLAPSISPGKSWEGAVGGWLAVLVVTAVSAMYPDSGETFPANVFLTFGAIGFIVLMTLLVAASIVGDLFESMLKRRAGMKDSSNLLPGHGGVLDRIDALIPVLPLAALIEFWLA